MDKTTVVSELNNLIQESQQKILPTKWIANGVIGAPYRVDYKLYSGWFIKAYTFLKLFLSDNNEFLKRFAECKENRFSYAEAGIEILQSLIEYIEKGFVDLDNSESIDAIEVINRITKRFHKVTRQLRNRHENRNTLDVKDEYDVQDLLHTLLRLFFDDIRSEEWTPSYAGKSARMDFLLKNESIVIEVKKTRQWLTDKELGDQLIVDVDRYKVHPNCKKLICFVYDPEGRIGNPEGLKNDLNGRYEGFVSVIIEPNN